MVINKNLTLYLFLLTIISLSCNKKSKEASIQAKDIIDKTITLKFPDSVLGHQLIKGKLKYDLALDTINQSDIRSRYLFLHLTSESMKDLTLAEIKAMNHLTFEDTTNTGNFAFEIGFGSIGDRLLNGSVEDIIILKDSLPNGKVRIITKETNVAKNIYVKNNSSQNQKHI